MSNATVQATRPRTMTIGDRDKERLNNLDYLRLLAASAVVVSHAFPLSTGSIKREPMVLLTHGQLTLGRLAVAIFFIISGYLITASYDRSKDIVAFARARFLRIIPGLAFVVLLTVFVLGPIVTSLSAAEYFRSGLTYSYIVKTIALRSPDSLPGVFQDNVFRGAVNGSLWTLFYEVLCYGIVAMLGLIRLIKRPVVLAIFVISMLIPLPLPHWFSWHRDFFGTWFEFLRVFSAGMLFYVFRNSIRLSPWLALVSLVGLAVSSYCGSLNWWLPTLGTYLVLFFGFTPLRFIRGLPKGADLSYGIYIYAFPVQQTITQCFGGKMSPFLNFLLSFPVIVFLSGVSWFLVESRFLRLKKKRLQVQ